MSRPLHRVVLSRLMDMCTLEAIWSTKSTRHNFRNLFVNGVEVDMGDPRRFRPPLDGYIQTDYLQYNENILRPKRGPAFVQTWRSAVDLASETAILRLLEVTKVI